MHVYHYEQHTYKKGINLFKLILSKLNGVRKSNIVLLITLNIFYKIKGAKTQYTQVGVPRVLETTDCST